MGPAPADVSPVGQLALLAWDLPPDSAGEGRERLGCLESLNCLPVTSTSSWCPGHAGMLVNLELGEEAAG